VRTGVLYYGDQAADGVKASTFVKELTTRSEYDNFVSSQPANILTVGHCAAAALHPLWGLESCVVLYSLIKGGVVKFTRTTSTVGGGCQPSQCNAMRACVPSSHGCALSRWLLSMLCCTCRLRALG
jgi:hypothetical protein